MANKVKALRDKVQKIIQTTEYRSTKIHGISCSRSDQEMIVMYCDTFLQHGSLNGLMRPMGNVGDVFSNAKIQIP